MWVIPHRRGVVSEIPLLRQGDRAGVAMEMHHLLGLVNVVQQVLGRNDVDNRNFCRAVAGKG